MDHQGQLLKNRTMSFANYSSNSQSSFMPLYVTRRVSSPELCSAIRERGSGSGFQGWWVRSTREEQLKLTLGRVWRVSLWVTILHWLLFDILSTSLGSSSYCSMQVRLLNSSLLGSWLGICVLEIREGLMQWTMCGLSCAVGKGSLVSLCDSQSSSLSLLEGRRRRMERKYLGMGRRYFFEYSSTNCWATEKVTVSLFSWKQASNLGTCCCQQAVFRSTSETNSITILASHCRSVPSRQRGAASRLALKLGLSHTLIRPSQSIPTISSHGRKLPAKSCNFWKPASAAPSTYKLSGSGMS